jgi:hypothetical protein
VVFKVQAVVYVLTQRAIWSIGDKRTLLAELFNVGEPGT